MRYQGVYPQKHNSILIVEDEPGVASFVARGPDRTGHQPEIATTGDGGLALALDKEYDTPGLDLSFQDDRVWRIMPSLSEAKEVLTFRSSLLTALGSYRGHRRRIEGSRCEGDYLNPSPFKIQGAARPDRSPCPAVASNEATPEKLASADLSK